MVEYGSHFGVVDWCIVIFYFVAMAAVGPIFARRNKSTEGFFLGNRSFPAWLLGLAMFATSISSVTVVAYPGDAYKTAYLRLLPAFMLPVGIFICSKIFLPFYRRSKCTSAYEYLEDRYGNGVRTYISVVFLLMQITRIGTILFLVSMVFQQMTGADPLTCIVIGGAVIATYTALGGMRAIVWTQFVQTFLLWFGAITCLVVVLRGIDGGIPAVISTAMANHKFTLGDPNAAGELVQAPWFSLRDKAILMMFLVGLNNWLYEYSSNQNVIQKYSSAKNPREATKSIWICCFLSVPTWAFFMFLGTSLYVYFQQHADQTAHDILVGANGMKSEAILPYFCVRAIPSGLAGIVITGILAAAMSASASSINAISAVTITDIYKRHLVKGRDEKHYVLAARVVSIVTCIMMMGCAALFLAASKLTLQDLGTKLASLLFGGILGLYMLGFLTRRGTARSAAVGIVCTVVFTVYGALGEWKIVTKEMFMNWGISESISTVLAQPVNTYYIGIFGNIIMFAVIYVVSLLFEREKRDLTNLTVWTTEAVGEEE